jgi:glucose dehydrogenase
VARTGLQIHDRIGIAGAASITHRGIGVFRPTDWPVYGHDPGGMRFSPLRQIPGEAGPRGVSFVALETTPLVVDNVMYISTPESRVIALDPDTSHELRKPSDAAVSSDLLRAMSSPPTPYRKLS